VPIIIMCGFFVEGAVQAMGVPSSQAVVAAAAPYGRASAAQGLAGSLNLLAAAVSAFAGPVVYERWGPEAAFTAAGAVVLVCAVLAVARRGPTVVPTPLPAESGTLS
jgi:predicted MFS family arabinose efflux permease